MTATALAPSPVEEKRKPGRRPNSPTQDRDFGIEIDPSKTYEFETLQKSEAYRTQGLSGECVIYDPVEKRLRTIRYIPQSESIFKDEQDEAYTDAHVKPLYFSRDKLYINGSDRRGVEYCLMHDRYDGVKPEHRQSGKGAFFTLVDKNKHERQLDAALANETLALTMIKESTIEKLRPTARIVFNIIDTDEIIIRNRLREYAKTPGKGPLQKSGALQIIENVDSPILIRRYNIQLALDKGMIKMDNTKGVCTWGDTENQICPINPSTKPTAQVNDLATWTFTKDGEAFYSILRDKF